MKTKEQRLAEALEKLQNAGYDKANYEHVIGLWNMCENAGFKGMYDFERIIDETCKLGNVSI